MKLRVLSLMMAVSLVLCACSAGEAASEAGPAEDSGSVVEAIPEAEQIDTNDSSAEAVEAAPAEPEETAEAVVEEAPAEPETAAEEAAAQEETPGQAPETAETQEAAAQGPAATEWQRKEINIDQRGWTQAVPAEYFAPSYYPGTVERFEYTTENYIAANGEEFTKPCYVYLPCGYDPDDKSERYDILYYMHGVDTTAEELFTSNDGQCKNMLDNMMMNGLMPKTIVVSCTFDRFNEPQEYDWSLVELGKFHLEFLNDVMPAVESHYNTYAASTSKEDLIASRNHRAFAGFSLGGVTTWNEFCTNYDYIEYYLPISGTNWYYSGPYDEVYDVDRTLESMQTLIEDNDLNNRGYFIYACTGTADDYRTYINLLMEPMMQRNDVFTKDHVVYYMKDGGEHDFDAVMEYLYNGLQLFW